MIDIAERGVQSMINVAERLLKVAVEFIPRFSNADLSRRVATLECTRPNLETRRAGQSRAPKLCFT